MEPTADVGRRDGLSPSAEKLSQQKGMKFAKDLAINVIEKWQAHYIDYRALKDVLGRGPSEETKVPSLTMQRVSYLSWFRSQYAQYLDPMSPWSSQPSGPVNA